MRPLDKFKALLESKGIYAQAMYLLREHKRLREAAEDQDKKEKPEDQKAKPFTKKKGKGPRDHEKDQMDYPWNEPGAPFRSSDY